MRPRLFGNPERCKKQETWGEFRRDMLAHFERDGLFTEEALQPIEVFE